MGCNCRKKKPAPPKPPPTEQAKSGTGGTQKFSLQMRDGTVRTFGSKLERDAALIRDRRGH